MRVSLLVAPLLVSAVASADPAPPTTISIVDIYHPKSNRLVWRPLVGDQGISDVDFYHLVGREDLAAEVHDHHVRAGVAGAAAIAAMGYTLYEIIQANQLPNDQMCFGQTTVDGLNACVTKAQATADAENHTHVMPAIVGGGAAVGLLAYMTYELATTPHVSTAEAHALAQRYNAAHVMPYAAPGGGGVSMGGSF